jgi:hypothetical protein
MDKVQKHNSFNTNTPSSESYRKYTVFWLESLKGRDHFEDLGMDGTITSEWILGKLWTGYISFRIGASGRLL